MGIIVGGVFGKIRKSVGGVTFRNWKGINTASQKVDAPANPRTASQVNNRTRFTNVTLWASIVLIGICQPLLNRLAKGMSGYNLFVNWNAQYFDENGPTDLSSIEISRGSVTAVDTLHVGTIPSNGSINIEWVDNTGDGNALASDLLYGMLYNATKDVLVAFDVNSLREDTGVSITIPVDWITGDIIHAYGAFRRADGLSSSDTSYVTEAAG